MDSPVPKRRYRLELDKDTDDMAVDNCLRQMSGVTIPRKAAIGHPKQWTFFVDVADTGPSPETLRAVPGVRRVIDEDIYGVTGPERQDGY
jgi:hypothetical protein